MENRDEMGWSAACFRYYAEIGRNSRGRVIPSVESSQLNLVLKEPYGVVGAIVPWNYPILLMAWKVAPALAAGNTVVIKPSEMTPLSTLAFADIFDHLPPGVVNIVTGYGREAGEPLVLDPRVRVIAFTGSLETGRQHRAPRRRPDEEAAPGTGWQRRLHRRRGRRPRHRGAWRGLGGAAQHRPGLHLHRARLRPRAYRASVHRAHRRVCARAAIGRGLEPQTDVGPMIGDTYRAKVEAHVADARARGARVLAGGRRPPSQPRGYFYEPTVLVNVDHSMRIMREETFGPTIPIMTYRTFDEAIQLANDSPFGLGANLYTQDARKVKQFYEEVQAGTLWVNDPLTDNDAGPFGGMKMSGLGRELGEEGLDEFRETKHLHWDFEGGSKPWWYPYGR